MTRREDQLHERIHDLQEMLVQAAIMVTEARERAEAAAKAMIKSSLSQPIHPSPMPDLDWKARAEAAEKRVTELVWQVNNMRNRAEAAEKRVKELEQEIDAMYDALEAKP